MNPSPYDQVCEILESAGYTLPMHVIQSIIDSVRTTILKEPVEVYGGKLTKGDLICDGSMHLYVCYKCKVIRGTGEAQNHHQCLACSVHTFMCEECREFCKCGNVYCEKHMLDHNCRHTRPRQHV